MNPNQSSGLERNAFYVGSSQQIIRDPNTYIFVLHLFKTGSIGLTVHLLIGHTHHIHGRFMWKALSQMLLCFWTTIPCWKRLWLTTMELSLLVLVHSDLTITAERCLEHRWRKETVPQPQNRCDCQSVSHVYRSILYSETSIIQTPLAMMPHTEIQD